MRVLLINTPALFERPISRSMAGGLGFDGNADMVLPPLDLAYLAAYLREGGHEVGLFDADGMAWDRATTLLKVAEWPCDVLICAASLPTLYGDCAFLQEVRKHHRGPAYAKTNVPDRGVLREMLERSGADGVIYGEPEASICGIVEGTTTDNLVCLRDGEVAFGERRAVDDVDQLLMPARDLLPNERYTYPLLGRGLATVQSSRGCPFPCGYYCPYPLVEGKKWRARSPERVADELEQIVRVHGIGKVLFRDATFTLDKDRAHAICDEIIARGLKLVWWCETRVDRLGRPLLEKLRAAGCLGINIGVETGDEEVMVGQAKRGLSMEKLIRLRNDAKEVGLALHFLMLVGFPDETRRSILASYDLIQDLQPESLGITLITPYPGTPLHQEAVKRGWIEAGSTWSDYGGHQPVMHTDHMTTEELVHGLEALHRGFRLLKQRGKVDDTALQRALDEDYMRLQAWASEGRENPLKLYSGPDVSARDRQDGQDAAPTPALPASREGVLSPRLRGDHRGGFPPSTGGPQGGPKSDAPVISVVIPTYNRRDDLLRCLKALDAQTLPASAFEVIVCDDGSTDGTQEAVEGYRAAYALNYLRQENRGPASARNAGIRAASGKVVLFIGDDIAADSRLLERHAAGHRSGPQELAVLGHTAWPPDLPVNELMRYITDVSCMQFGYHRIKDRNNVPFGFFYTSNVSVKRAFLMGSDLFDEGFPYAAFEDIELEYRLRQRGLKMVYDPEAVGYHYHPTDLGRFSERQYRAGLSAVYFHRKHPDPALDADILLVTKLLGKTTPTEAEIERLKVAAAEIEKMDLSKFSAIVSGGRPLEAQMREILHSFYGTVLSIFYLKGVQEASVNCELRIANCELSLNPQSAIRNPKSVDVSIIIPVFNNLSYTQRCLEAVFAHGDGIPYEVIVVDNASTDGTRVYLEGLGDRIRTIFNAYNVGFGRANNQATAVARGQYLLYLNNDTVPQAGWLREMVQVMASDDRVGAVGSKLLYPDTKLVQHAGVELINGVPDHPFRGTAADDPRVNRTRDLDMVTGACLMVRKELFDRLGGFDEQYVNGVEDVDLCLRIRDAGYRVVYCATSVVEHYEGRSAGRFDRVQENLRLFFARWQGRFDATGRFVLSPPEEFTAKDSGVGQPSELTVGWEDAKENRKQSAVNMNDGTLRGVWEGSFFVRHSLALVNREVCGALIRSGRCELSLVPYEADEFSAESDPERFRPLAERMGAALKGPADFHVRHQWPPNFEPPASGHWIMIQPWEFGRLPKAWIRPMTEEVDEVWVPSAFVKRCYAESGVPAEKVFVAPNGVNGDIFRPDAQPMDLPTCKSFRFLFVGGTIYRKGIDVLLDVYAKTFRRSDDVCLVIKDMGQSTFYKGQSAAERIRELQQDPDAPEILYLTEALSDRVMAGLYKACDCLVHPYRGEGFGLPVAEAMACGLPAILTRGGACDEFCSEETAYFIPAQKVGISFKEETAGQAWLLEPDREALCDRMRWAVEHPDEAKARGAKASAFIRERVTWERAASAAAERLTALKGRPVLRDRKGKTAPAAARSVEVTAVLVQSGAERTKAAMETLERVCGRLCEVVPLDGTQAGPGLMAFLSERWATFRGRAVAVLSDGVVLTPGAMERLLTVLDADASVAVAVPSSNAGTGAQAVKPKYQSLKKELEKFARKVAHDRRGLVADVPWPDAPCVVMRVETFKCLNVETFKYFRTDAGLMALARAVRKTGRRVVCCREAYVHVEPGVLDDATRQREAEAVRCLETAEAAEAAGDGAGAVTAARRAVASAPVWATAHNELGRCLYRNGDAAGARSAFERAAEIEPGFAEAHSNLGVLLWEIGEQEGAVEAFNRAAQIEPENVDVLYNVGAIYAQIGEPQRAAVFFERCLALRPDDADIREQLEALHAMDGELQIANDA